MADDPYAALGVSRTATEAELKKAYRKIAKADHPDLTDDKAAHDRFKAASDAGFEAVEFLFPYEHAPEQIGLALAGGELEQALFNLPPGDWAKGERGIAALPGRDDEFRASIDRGASPDDLAEKVAVLGGLFDDAEAALAPDAATEASTFLGAFTILLREGLEALLIVVAMIAFLRKAERGEALRYVERVGIERIAAYEHALLDYATPRLADIAGVRLVGTAEEKASVLSFVLAGHEPLEVGKALNAEGIAVRAGHHCAQPILRRLGLEATVRPSFAFYNTFDEIDVFIDAVRRIAEGAA